MCGLAGILSGKGAATANMIDRMIDPIAHRGPDDQGHWIDPDAGIALGHRRLSIVELSTLGHQPMASADGRFVLSYNGEIYNHAALRREMEEAGLAPPDGWRGHSDTETLLQGFATWGLSRTLDKLVGMFAFALWDRTERSLTLARDRFGEKPLYYGWADDDFVFASELKAIRAHPRFQEPIDRQALALFASRTYIPAPHSIYRGLFKLLPGCTLTIAGDRVPPPRTEAPREGERRDGVTLSRYWSYPDVVAEGLADPLNDETAALNALEAALSASIRGQSIADVPVGAFLSGGIDSSTVVALYQESNNRPVRTYSIGFEEAGFDEAVHAKAVAARLGTIHHEHYVTSHEARDVIPLLPTMYDEPFADSSQIPTFLVSRFARNDVTVALTGDGGDELFAGYNRHVTTPRLWNSLPCVPAPLRTAGGALLGAIPTRWWSGALAMTGAGPALNGAKLRKAIRVAGQSTSIDDVYRSFLDEWAYEPSPVTGAGAIDVGIALPNIAGGDATTRMTLCDATSYLPDDILCKVDRASMAVSLETRVPFLDHRVAEIAARIPVSMKVHGGVGKQILRQLLFRKVPASLFDRPKAGFAVPIGQWIRGPLRPWAEELLAPGRMKAEGWFDAARIQRRWKDHLDGRRDSTPALWSVLMFQAWLDAQRD